MKLTSALMLLVILTYLQYYFVERSIRDRNRKELAKFELSSGSVLCLKKMFVEKNYIASGLLALEFDTVGIFNFLLY